jgi:hypothetical protein
MLKMRRSFIKVISRGSFAKAAGQGVLDRDFQRRDLSTSSLNQRTDIKGLQLRDSFSQPRNTPFYALGAQL